MTIVLGGTFILAFIISMVLKKSSSPVTSTNGMENNEDTQNEETKITEQRSSNSKNKKKQNDKKVKEKAFSHPWLLSSLKGHSGRVLDMDLSPNGKYLASCSEDRTVLVWTSKEFAEKEHKCLRCNVEYDHGAFVKWSPDSKAFVVQKVVQNCTEVYKMGKKADGSLGFSVAVTFPQIHKTDTIGMGISSSGKFIATCSDKTDLIIWNLKGDVLDKLGKT